MNHDEWYDNLNWFKPTEPPQLLPRDILIHARMFSGAEVERQITKHIEEYVTARHIATPSDPVNHFNFDTPINVANGDSIEFTWTWHNPNNDASYVAPQKIVFYSTATGSVYTKRTE